MAVYRITEFSSPDMEAAASAAEALRGDIAAAGALFIDIVDVGGSAGLVVAKYADEASMEAAGSIAQASFGKMVQAGVIDGASIKPRTGTVAMSLA